MGHGGEVRKGRAEKTKKMGHLGTSLRSTWYEPNGKPVGAFTLSCG